MLIDLCSEAVNRGRVNGRESDFTSKSKST